MARSLHPAMWKWRISAAAYPAESPLPRGFLLLQITGPSHCCFHSARQGVVSSFGRQFHQRAHRGDLIAVLIHSPVEGAAVFCTEQGLRRTSTLSHVGHIQPMSVDHVVKVSAPLFLDTEAVNTLGGIMSEGL